MNVTRTLGLDTNRLLLIVILAYPGLALAAHQPLFSDHAPIDLTLTGPWAKLAADSSGSPQWRAATLRLADGIQLSVKVAPRGKSRRRKNVCDFPPLRLNFKRSEVVNSVFADQNKLKLVTHCGRLGARNVKYSDRLHSEYLLYRILNHIDSRSFAVRAVRVTYVDSDRQKKSYTHPGFFIEHKQQLATRLKADLLKQPRVALTKLDSSYAANAALFAYFAGNTDFAFTSGPKNQDCCHNAVPLQISQPDSTEKVISVPYDFDATGFVNPPYAAPATTLGLIRVTDRLHRGYCSHRAQVPSAITRFLDAKTDIYELIRNHPALSEKRMKRLLKYTAKFYKVLADPETSNRRILSVCR